MSIDWSQDYGVQWRLMKVDKDSWVDNGVAAFVKSVHIDRDATSSVPMLESASIDVQIPVREEWEDGWYRFEGVFTQWRYTVMIPMMTFLVESSDGDIDFGYVTGKLDGYSVLKPAADRSLLIGSYVPKGVDGAEYAGTLLASCLQAPVQVQGSFTLDDYMPYGADTSYLKVVWDILDAGNFCMSIAGDGTVTVKPKPTEPSLTLDASAKRILFPKISRDVDRSSIPNVYTAISGDMRAQAINDNPQSKVSTVSRGRVVDYVDLNPTRINGESLQAYTERKLEEVSTVYQEFSYKREFQENVHPFDLATASLPDQGMVGDMRILSQSIDCGEAITVSETAAKVIKEYEAA